MNSDATELVLTGTESLLRSIREVFEMASLVEGKNGYEELPDKVLQYLQHVDLRDGYQLRETANALLNAITDPLFAETGYSPDEIASKAKALRLFEINASVSWCRIEVENIGTVRGIRSVRELAIKGLAECLQDMETFGIDYGDPEIKFSSEDVLDIWAKGRTTFMKENQDLWDISEYLDNKTAWQRSHYAPQNTIPTNNHEI